MSLFGVSLRYYEEILSQPLPPSPILGGLTLFSRVDGTNHTFRGGSFQNGPSACARGR